MAAGSTLAQFSNLDRPLLGFSVIMLISMVCRFDSVAYLSIHYDVPYRKTEGTYFSFVGFHQANTEIELRAFYFFHDSN